jgi:Raf kinase inhibitor-like YbhB/YbcL family protein
MYIRSDSFEHRQRIPAEFAAGQATADGFGFAPNRNPHLAWGDAPAGTKSFVLLCVDPDVPTEPEMVGKPGVLIPSEQPRCDFVHWAMVDIPTSVSQIVAGSCSDGVVPHGKTRPAGPAGARQGMNDYTGWFGEDASLAGDWFGYDGPFPPPNDLRLHRYFFRLFALDIDHLPVPDRFTAAQATRAMHGHVLDEVAIYGTYSLNASVKD